MPFCRPRPVQGYFYGLESLQQSSLHGECIRGPIVPGSVQRGEFSAARSFEACRSDLGSAHPKRFACPWIRGSGKSASEPIAMYWCAPGSPAIVGSIRSNERILGHEAGQYLPFQQAVGSGPAGLRWAGRCRHLGRHGRTGSFSSGQYPSRSAVDAGNQLIQRRKVRSVIENLLPATLDCGNFVQWTSRIIVSVLRVIWPWSGQ